jgi:AcrR family transcriptional regulator
MLDNPAPKPRAPRLRSASAEQTRADIIAVAYAEFAEKGLSGASMNEIAARTRTSKPMIYYYFHSKERLYAAVMEAAYGRMRDIEQGLDLDHLPPEAAMRRLVEATFDYHAANPDFVRLISVENIHRARHIAGSEALERRNAAVIEIVRSLLERGVDDGTFRPGLDPVDVHLLMSSISFYRVSNRHSWAVLFGRDLLAPAHEASQRRMTVEAVLRYLRP